MIDSANARMSAVSESGGDINQLCFYEVGVINADDLGSWVELRKDFGCVRDNLGRHPDITMRDDLIAGVAVVEHGFEHLHPVSRNSGPAQSADQLFTLTREHRPADHLDPADVLCYEIHQSILLQRPGKTRPFMIEKTMRIACTGPRILRPELLDQEPPLAAVEEALKDLERINHWFGGHQVLLSLLREHVKTGERFSFLDVGAASGDLGTVVRRWYPEACVVSLDRKALHLKRAEGPRVAADAFRLPFSPGSIDIVFCSLFLHHFSSPQAVELLRGFRAVARRALLVIDLERHPLAYYFIPCTRSLFRWSELVVHDGKISVEAAWKPAELRRLAREAGLPGARVRRHVPWFRLSLSAGI